MTFNHGVEGSSPSALTKKYHKVNRLLERRNRTCEHTQPEIIIRLQLDCTSKIGLFFLTR
jgi:hypothetical protein